jgi:manganese efflux pump family protein
VNQYHALTTAGVIKGKLHPGEPSQAGLPPGAVSVRLGAVIARRYAATMAPTGVLLAGLLLAGLLLAGAAAGCSSQPAVTGGSGTSCYQFAATAIQRHVTVTVAPAACRGLSQVEVNVAVSRALRNAAAGVRGKVRQRQVIARDSRYVASLIRAVPAPSQPAATPSQPAATAPQSGLPAVTAPPSRPPNRTALGLAALIAWLVTVGLGLSMMARWITRTRRHGPRPRRERRGPVLNFTHFGLALTGLLIWISYLVTGLAGLAWTACGLLLAVASLGMTLVFLPATTATPPGDHPLPAAARPPVLVIAVHITAAVVTILLATLAAVG